MKIRVWQEYDVDTELELLRDIDAEKHWYVDLANWFCWHVLRGRAIVTSTPRILAKYHDYQSWGIDKPRQ